jgi:two-component system LytT family response regulator
MRVLIVDDESPARAKVRRLLADAPDVEIVGEAASGREAVDAIVSAAPDVVFLDVQMPELDGFGVIDEIGVDNMPQVVFTTAYDEHALKAFEVRALDYLLKPFTPERFQRVLERAREQLRRDDGAHAVRAQLEPLMAALARAPSYLRRVLVRTETRALLLPVERIDRVQADRNYVRLIAGQEEFVVRTSISSFAERLDPARFLRINRSEIVRLDAVKELQPWFHGDYRVVMHDGVVLMWSRRYRAAAAADFAADGR